MTHPPIVRVIWEDASHDTFGWGESLEKAAEFQVSLVVSIGFFVAKNKRGLKICQSVTDGAIAQTLVIPQKMIQSLEIWGPNASKVYRPRVHCDLEEVTKSVSNRIQVRGIFKKCL